MPEPEQEPGRGRPGGTGAGVVSGGQALALAQEPVHTGKRSARRARTDFSKCLEGLGLVEAIDLTGD